MLYFLRMKTILFDSVRILDNENNVEYFFGHAIEVEHENQHIPGNTKVEKCLVDSTITMS